MEAPNNKKSGGRGGRGGGGGGGGGGRGGGGGGRGQNRRHEEKKQEHAVSKSRKYGGGVPVEDDDREQRHRRKKEEPQKKDYARPSDQREVMMLPQRGPFTAFISGMKGQDDEKELFDFLGSDLVGQKEAHRWRDNNIFIDFKSADALMKCLKLNGSRFGRFGLRVEIAKPLKKAEKKRGGGGGGGRDRARFSEYIPLDEASEMLKKGLLCQGAIRVNPHNRHEAYATVPSFAYDVKFCSLSAQNRALDGDEVAIRINPVDKWIKMEDAEAENKTGAVSSSDSDVEGSEEQAAVGVASVELTPLQELQKRAASENLRPTGTVVAVLREHHDTSFVGWLRACNEGETLTRDSKFAFFFPFNKKMHRILVPLDRLKPSWRDANKFAKNLYRCELKSWDIKSTSPFGKLVKDYGEGGDLEVEKTILMEANNIDFDDTFSVACNACLPPKDFVISAEEIAKRRDLRSTLICSIDPATARDLDDALSISRLENGNWEVGVHIADVTHFLQAGTALDDEARSRCTSVYLVDQCIPMLPRILSERLCSLNSGQDSLAFSAIFELSRSGEVVSQWFGKSIIRNCMQMSYELAQSIIDGVAKDEDFKIDPHVAHLHSIEKVREAIINLNKLGHVLRKIRFENGGSVQLESVKLSFKLDPETGKPVQKPANELVEEFMLLANRRVAEFILAKFPDGALLRKHEKPGAKMAEFVKMCGKFGYKIDPSTSFSLNASLDNVNDPAKPAVRKVIYHLALRAMQLAKYTHTDPEFPVDTYYWHYALAYKHYTHFTSPIRRYADCMVHRILFAALQPKVGAPESKETIQAICEKCNERKSLADRASDRSDVVFLCHLLKDKKPEILEGYVFRVTAKGADVMCPEYGIEDAVMLDKLGLVKESSLQEEGSALAVEFDSYNEEYFLGQPVPVDVEKLPRKLVFRMFDKVQIICKIKDSKRELDMGLRIVLGAE